MFLIDHAGLPLKTVLEQLDLLGDEVVPVLRKEFAVGRPEHVPDAPTHETFVATARPRHRPHRSWLTLGAAPAMTTSGDRQWRIAGAVVDAAAGRPVTAAVEAALAGRKLTATASVIELRRLGRPIMDAMLTGFAPSDLESAFETVADADGLIAVTPAFNASFSGLFKSFFDVLPEETLTDMPVLIAATGGTERHSLVLEHALRPMFSYLHAIVSPTGVYAATDDFGARADFRRTGRADRQGGHRLRPPAVLVRYSRAPRRLRRAADRHGTPPGGLAAARRRRHRRRLTFLEASGLADLSQPRVFRHV